MHVPEILALHDLSRDPGAGSPEEFRVRSLANASSRCLRRHVVDEESARARSPRDACAVRAASSSRSARAASSSLTRSDHASFPTGRSSAFCAAPSAFAGGSYGWVYGPPLTLPAPP